MAPTYTSFDNKKVFNSTDADLNGLILDKAANIYAAPPGVETISAVIQADSQSIADAFYFKEKYTKTNGNLEIGLKQTWATTFAFWNANYILDI
ncbi:hypothetical protein As57867_006495, partial [Aphanomyces stellatus]